MKKIGGTHEVQARPQPLWAAALAVMATSCASISYKPSLSLGTSPVTVKARVLVNDFQDSSPPDDKDRVVAGASATEPGTLAGPLTTEVTNAVVIDLSINHVFESVDKRVDNPDLVMSGVIHRFYGKVGPNALFWTTLPVDIIWFAGLPVQSDKGAVELEVALQRPDGTPVSTYWGRAQFGSWYTIYNNPVLGIGTRLNRAFDQAVGEIRQQIVADAAKLSARVH